MRTVSDSLDDFLYGLSGALLVEKPCKVINVNSQYSVDIEYYDNNEPDCLYNVPVKHCQTKNAFVYLGLKPGDRGTVRFFDTDVGEYTAGTNTISVEQRLHDINDNVFSCGFYPEKEKYVFPEGDVVIGTTNGAVVNLTSNSVTISGANVVISGSSVNISANTTIDGKKFLEHTHSNGNEGNPTGGVI